LATDPCAHGPSVIRYARDPLFRYLMKQQGDHFEMSEEIICAAAGNEYHGQEIMALLLQLRGEEVHITDELVCAVAGYESYRGRMVEMLYEHHDSRLAHGNRTMMMLLRLRGHTLSTTSSSIARIASSFDESVIALLLNLRGDDIQITDEIVTATAENWGSGGKIMKLLLELRGHTLDTIGPSIDVIIRSFDETVVETLLRLRGKEIGVSDKIICVAIENRVYGYLILALLVELAGDEIEITAEVTCAVARNKYCSERITALLLELGREEIQIIEEVVSAAAENEHSGREVIKLLLRRRGHTLSTTSSSIARIASSFDKSVIALLLNLRGDNIQIIDEIITTAAENWGSSGKIMKLLLELRRRTLDVTGLSTAITLSSLDHAITILNLVFLGLVNLPGGRWTIPLTLIFVFVWLMGLNWIV
jgi:hypothetical protein